MSYHQGFLYLSNAYGNAVEVVNEARTAANLQRAINAGLKRFGDVSPFAGCSALLFAPCAMGPTGLVTEWAALNTAASAAPWYNPITAASSEALGFYIEEWTGLDGAHHGASVTPFGAGRGGGSLGPQASGARTMAINVILVGSSERGLNFLFRWLESTLLSCCDPHARPSLYIREYCGQGPDPEEGLARADDVGLVAGPTWEAPPVEEAGCFLRRASFTLTAGSPSFFREPVLATSATSLKSAITPTTTSTQSASVARFVGTSVRVAATMPTPEYGMVSPRVTITSAMTSNTTSGLRRVLPDLRIYGMLNPGAASLSDPYRMFPIGCVILNNIPSGATVVVDVGAAKIWYTDNYGSLETLSGMSYLLAAGPSFRGNSSLVGARLKRWFGFNNCQTGVVVVEPDVVDTTTVMTDNITADWTVKIESVVRIGSC